MDCLRSIVMVCNCFSNRCPSGTDGKQYEYDACQAGACKNGATCIDEGPGFTCICPSGYTGDWFNNFAEIFLTRI